jgi:type I restriction enzyme R subunit
MTKIGQSERKTQNRIVKLFQEKLGYKYLGDWQYNRENSNIEAGILTEYLERQGYSEKWLRKRLV